MTDSERPRAAIDSHIARTLPPWRLPERKRMEPFSYPILRRHELAQGGFGPWSSLRRSSVGATAADAANEARNAIDQVDEAGKYHSERQRQDAAQLISLTAEESSTEDVANFVVVVGEDLVPKGHGL